MDLKTSEPSEDWVQAVFDPKSVAVIGASDNPEKIGGRPIKYMRQHGFRGRLYPVNPSRPEIQGLKAWPDVDALPEAPDLAVVCVPGDAAVAAVAACARRGVKVGVVISSGFAETGQAGREAQQRMLEAARTHGMRLIGPNTQGTVNFANGAIASFATLIGEVGAEDGPVAIVSQSGAMSVVPYVFLRGDGVGVRHSHATGNECDLTVADLAWAVAGDPAVRLILLYFESVPDPQALARAVRRAASRGVPVLALKAGISARGQAAASSHTGAVATEDRVLGAFMRQHGIVRVPDMHSLVRSARLWLQADVATAEALDSPGGRRVAAISNSGACCVMAADAAERHGLAMVPFEPATRDAVAGVMPAFASAANPVDLTAALLSDSGLFGRVLPLIARYDAADLYFISLPMSGKGYDVDRFAADAAHFRATTGKPVVVCSPLEATRRTFERAGIVTFEHDEDAMAALGELANGRARMREARRLMNVMDGVDMDSRRGPRPARQRSPDRAMPTSSAAGQFLSEHDSLAFVAAMGIPVVPYSLCRSVEEVASATASLCAPWAIKACSAAIPHKSDHGLVRLGVDTASDAVAAFRSFHARCRELGLPLEGVIVARMCKAQHELVLGARWDARFGSIVIAGDGGKYVEAMPDVATAIYPFDAEHFEGLLDGLRIAPLWQGVRGEKALPRRALAEAAVALGRWMADQNGDVLSVDINPLMASPEDTLYAADALVERVGVGAQANEAARECPG